MATRFHQTQRSCDSICPMLISSLSFYTSVICRQPKEQVKKFSHGSKQVEWQPAAVLWDWLYFWWQRFLHPSAATEHLLLHLNELQMCIHVCKWSLNCINNVADGKTRSRLPLTSVFTDLTNIQSVEKCWKNRAAVHFWPPEIRFWQNHNRYGNRTLLHRPPWGQFFLRHQAAAKLTVSKEELNSKVCSPE